MATCTLPTYTIRQYRPSDIPQILAGHRTEYIDKYGWNEYFMSVVDDLLTRWTAHHDPTCERFWIAENATTAEFLGCVMLINKPPEIPTGEEETGGPVSSTNPSIQAAKSDSSLGKEDSKPKARTARLRILFVSPSARGLGLGRTLVRLTTDFAREMGYSKVQLSTCLDLGAAIKIYKLEGYGEVSWEDNEIFGPKMRHVVLELEL